MRVAIYARYSSDRQSEASIDDQVRLCRERAARQGWHVVEVYSDYAISGAAALNRPALQQLLVDARGGRFAAVLAEALDRISRDQEDVAGLYKRLAFAGVGIVTVAEGEISELHVGLKGTMNALYLKDLAQKVRRGQRGRTEAGRSAGGLPYGYDVVRELDAAGELVRGKRRINPGQADVIRRIYADYAAGLSAKAIAHALNREGVPAPRGGGWNVSTINGSRARRNGILHNELYAGRIVWNRQRFLKDPESGRRLPRLNPRSDWITVEAPELRIVSEELWQATRRVKADHVTRNGTVRPRPKRLLSGLLFCGRCGGSFTLRGGDRLACSRHREQGTCDNNRTIRLAELEERVLAGLRDRLVAPDAIAAAVAAYHAEARRRRADAGRAQARAARELREVTAEIGRIVDAIARGTDTPALRARLMELDGPRREALEAELAVPAEPVVVPMHPNLAALYRARVASLQAALNRDPDTRRQAVALLRTLIHKIVLHPGAHRGAMGIELHGALAALINLARHRELTENQLLKLLVAGDRYGRSQQYLPLIVHV